MKKLVTVVLWSAIIYAGWALDTAKIDNLTGLKGKLNENEGVYRISFARDVIDQREQLLGESAALESIVSSGGAESMFSTYSLERSLINPAANALSGKCKSGAPG
jgi:hypothetical protein